MIKSILISSIVSFLILMGFLSSCNVSSSKKATAEQEKLIALHKQEVLKYQEKANLEFADSSQSPLDSADLVHFESLDFYPPDYNYRVEAKFIKSENEKPFKMPTTTEREPEYIKYGELHFKILGEKLKLNVYQNLELVKNEKYKHYLFLPFTDLTNALTTYGGGRYLDLEYNGEETVVLDFNKAYNPYCAYSGRWSCPIPPEENDLNVEIKAGVKSFH